ncbi:MAG: tRNA pseudouridine(38-40) synthase TruA [Eudoraea sp.]|uniref:tRNA pseudouridine synthase A n=1 Tax=Eudoraea sp. TaxID=1979955 RepID=UPI003C746A16
MKRRHYYLIRVQFLGFRYSGWQKQPGQRTIEGMLLKTLKYILPQQKLKILGAGRTDAKVSALDAAFELIIEETPISDISDFVKLFNKNLPSDIKVIKVDEVDKNFNIIKDSKFKEYCYYFSYGEKNHPFCAPFMANILEDLDIEIMTKAAALYKGTHNFKTYTAKPGENKQVTRTLSYCEIIKNTEIYASFFPKNSYVLRICGKGFMRYQVRMIMGALIQLGRGLLSLDEIERSLMEETDIKISYIAPGSGLVLHKLEFV